MAGDARHAEGPIVWHAFRELAEMKTCVCCRLKICKVTSGKYTHMAGAAWPGVHGPLPPRDGSCLSSRHKVLTANTLCQLAETKQPHTTEQPLLHQGGLASTFRAQSC